MSLTIGFWDGLSAKSRMRGFFSVSGVLHRLFGPKSANRPVAVKKYSCLRLRRKRLKRQGAVGLFD
jgi:hypothetical protein